MIPPTEPWIFEVMRSSLYYSLAFSTFVLNDNQSFHLCSTSLCPRQKGRRSNYHYPQFAGSRHTMACPTVKPLPGPGRETVSKQTEQDILGQNALCPCGLFPSFIQGGRSLFQVGLASLSQKNREPPSLPWQQPRFIFHELPGYGPNTPAPGGDGKRRVLLSGPQQRCFVACGSGCLQVYLPACKQVGLEGSGAQGLRSQSSGSLSTTSGKLHGLFVPQFPPL